MAKEVEMNQIELPYPATAGYKNTQTSKDAALKVTGKRETDWARVIAALKSHPAGLTADEIAEVYGEVFNKFRPRCSELKLRGVIEVVPGDGRPTHSGQKQDILRCVS